MKVKFEFLEPSKNVVGILEAYENMGYEVNTLFAERNQWEDDSIYMSFLVGKGDDWINVLIPKTEFKKKIVYYDWMPREEFEKLCKQDASYYFLDCILVTDLHRFMYKPNGCDFKVSKDLYSLALGFFDRENAWKFNGGVYSKASKFKYVKIIKREQE